MYESFFELSQRPFVPNPLTSRYYAGAAIERARSTLVRCVERGEGAGLVVGASGTGKTLLCYLLAEQFRDSLAVAMLFSGHLASRQDLLRAILFELGQPYRGMDEGELRLSLIDYLSRSDECSQGLLLLIDEAHALPLRLLEEIRMISNLVRGGQPQVRLVLVGGPALEEHFASPKLESFAQRLAARCYLEPLDRQETFHYVRSQLQAVGAEPSRIFTDPAIEAVYRATDGIPRLINQVCDHALVFAHGQGVRRLDAMEVETAWADLQQLPAPWSESGSAGSPSAAINVVEFGDLDDEFFASGPELRLALPPSELLDDESPRETAGNLEVDEAISVTDQHLDHLKEQWELLGSDFLESGQDGLPEVELVFDDALSTDEHAQLDPLVSISYTKAGDKDRGEQYREAIMEGNEPVSVERPGQQAPQAEQAYVQREIQGPPTRGSEGQHGEPMTDNAMPHDEEVIHDRYAVLDALKNKGVFDRHAVLPKPVAPRRPVASPFYQSAGQESHGSQRPASTEVSHGSTAAARPNLEAEKNLTLAEALVRHATLVEQTSVQPPRSPESLFSVLSMPAPAEAAPTDAWTPLVRESLDTLAAPPEYAAQLASAASSGRDFNEQAAPAPASRNQSARVVALDGSVRGMAFLDELDQSPEAVEYDELDLIVVEDDPQSVVIPTAPQATPVRRQEYRQLFARLRKS